MDREKPVYVRQKSNSSGGTPGVPNSQWMNSPVTTHHSRSGSVGTSGSGKKAQNTKAAAQRLAHVMAHKPNDEDDESDDDLPVDLGPTTGIGLGGSARATRPRSPMVNSARVVQEGASSARTTSAAAAAGGGRSAALSVKTGRPAEQTTRQSQSINTKPINSLEQSLRSSINLRSAQSSTSVEQPNSAKSMTDQPLSRRTSIGARSSQGSSSTSVNEQPSSARSVASAASVARPQFGNKPVHMVPSSVAISLRPSSSVDIPAENRRDPPVPILLRPPSSTMLSSDALSEIRRERRSNTRVSVDLGNLNLRDNRSQDSSALQDELDMLQEENDGLLEKLRLAEERIEETEARARQLEKQVASFGDGMTLEERLLSRKEAARQQREEALRMAAQTLDDRNDEAEIELQAIRMMTQRLILTREEKEDVILKRSWLARYWSLCVEHGIYADIAAARQDFWSSLAPFPVEAVLEAGNRAKEQTVEEQNDVFEREYSPKDMNELSGEGNIENMLLVEQGLRELASLKVEDAVAIVMARHRHPNSKSSEVKVPAEEQFESFDLSKAECDDVKFKQAWLTYFWRRAKNLGLEADIVDERLQFWMSCNTNPLSSHDAVDVERGLLELRKLRIESKLWAKSREIDPYDASS